MMAYGCETSSGQLRSVLVKSPRTAHQSQARVTAGWRAVNYPAQPDYDLATRQHDALMALLRQAGTEIHELPASDDTGLDSVYTHDPVIVTRRGAILCRMGKEARATEPEAAGEWLASVDIPILGRIHGPGLLEGGDLIWLDSRTVAVGEGYRTNAEGIRQLRALLAGLAEEVIPVPLPHWTGPADCLHLMSLISPIAPDLAVVYSRLLPVPFRQLLVDRGIELVEVPDEEYDSMACNILPVAPRQCIMLEGNPKTRAALEAAGARVWTLDGSDICLKGGGGPTCLTRPLLRT
ncbi:MAG: arginine deiminase family protein [Gemmatimonadota bacterium]|jgi:arginine deiminase|nr:arginine deiminase family protein [Gemmatimonadota bacterium]